jgi:hypothetical protein
MNDTCHTAFLSKLMVFLAHREGKKKVSRFELDRNETKVPPTHKTSQIMRCYTGLLRA